MDGDDDGAIVKALQPISAFADRCGTTQHLALVEPEGVGG